MEKAKTEVAIEEEEQTGDNQNTASVSTVVEEDTLVKPTQTTQSTSEEAAIARASLSNLITQQMPLPGDDWNVNQDQEADSTHDPALEETKLDTKVDNPDSEKIMTENILVEDKQANPLQVLLEAVEVIPHKVDDPEPTDDNMEDQDQDSRSTSESDLGKQDSKSRTTSPVLALTSTLKKAPEPQPPSPDVVPPPSLVDPET